MPVTQSTMFPGLVDSINSQRDSQYKQEMMQYKLDKAAYDKKTSLADMARVNEGLAPFFDQAVEGMDPATANYMRMQQQLMADPSTNKTGQSSLADMMKQRVDYRTGISKQDYERANPKPTSEMQNIANWSTLSPDMKDQAIERAKAMRSKTEINMNTSTDLRPMATPEQNESRGFPRDARNVVTKDGRLEPVKNATSDKVKQSMYLDSMNMSEEMFTNVLDEFPDFNPGNTKDFIARAFKGGEGILGALGELAGSKFESPESKAYWTAALNWVSANRALLSGAAVPEIEVQRDLQTYFPRPDDPEEVRVLKQQLRMDRKNSLAKNSILSEEDRDITERTRLNKDYLQVVRAMKKAKLAEKRAVESVSGKNLVDALGNNSAFVWQQTDPNAPNYIDMSTVEIVPWDD